MKKFFLMAIAAVAALTMTVSCDSEYAPDTFLSDITVSSSTVTFAPEGSAAKIFVNAAGAWEITELPEWVTVSPASGNGSTEVTFSVEAATETRTATAKISCNGETQLLTLMQMCAKVEPKLISCAEVHAAAEGATVRTKGVVTAIANTQYGNFYLNDGTAEVYVYGCLYDGKTQNNPIGNNNIEVGDEVTVEGPKKDYNGTIELVDVTVINVEKSLIKCDSTLVAGVNTNSIPQEGGNITAYFTNKGQGLYASVPAEVSEWVSIAEVSGNSITFHVAENTAGPRNATLVVRTTDGKKEYTANVEFSQDGLSGTLDLPMTVAEAIAAANAGVTKSVYVKGIVSELVKGGFDASYGNGSFWISADGVYNEDLSLDFEAYQVNWLGGEKWTAEDAQIEVGAEVLLYGPLTVYKGTAETQGKGAAYVYSVNGVTTSENGLGFKEAPFNAVGAIAAANAATGAKVYVKGIVSQLVKGGFDASYGNGSFWISNDGVFNNDLSLDFEAYQVNWLGGEKWNSETDPQISVGDAVTIYGPLTTYKGTAETQGKGAAYVYEWSASEAN